jgi:hypothetical protein
MSVKYCSHAAEHMAAALLQLILLQSLLQPLLPASCAGGPCSCPGWCCWCVIKLQDERVGRSRVLSQALLLLDDLDSIAHSSGLSTAAAQGQQIYMGVGGGAEHVPEPE